MKYDFGGYATKNDVKCSDGRTIKPDAFKHNDGMTVPLVWQHQHNEPSNVLGHAVLENKKDGVYAYATFNDTEAGTMAKKLVEHGDIKALSIYANGLVEKSKDVIHGVIREVSLVLSGANPGAKIDNVVISHGDQIVTDEEEAYIYSGEEIELGDITHGDDKDEKTIAELFSEFTEEQKNVVYAMMADMEQSAIDDNKDEDDDQKDDDDDLKHGDDSTGGKKMKKNVFNNDAGDEATLSHSQIKSIFEDAKDSKTPSLGDTVLAHAGTYGIDNIGLLFPDAQTIRNKPDWVKRDTGWVSGWLSGTKHTPFSRIKSRYADITPDEARAKGYVTGAEKDEEVFALAGRETTPQTVYKKQKLDRDDIIDITSFDVVSWMKGEMRLMLDEEIARAGLVGDGRSIGDPDKIKEDKVRPIYSDDDFYAHKILMDATLTPEEELEAMIRARKFYKGTGTPNFYTTTDKLTDYLLIKDTTGRRIYKTVAELKAVLRVKSIIEVEVMEGISRVDGDTIDLVGIFVNPADYSYGADKGGNIAFFDDFDIDFNQMKYLMETRISAALTRPKSALVIEKTQPAG